MDEREPIARLTEREKECLRAWLEHKTAKEIALDIGISHYAVEKRLKMARTKLDVTTSLEAARMLADVEGYGQPVAQPAEVETPAHRSDKWFTKPLTLGVIVMSIITATIVAIAAQTTGIGPSNYELDEQFIPPETGDTAQTIVIGEEFDPAELVAATPAEVLVIVQSSFQAMDEDNSGFLEGEEMGFVATSEPTPVFRRDAQGNVEATGEMVTQTREELRESLYQQADYDGDGRVALHEYRRWATPNLARQGIPAGWKEDINRLAQPSED